MLIVKKTGSQIIIVREVILNGKPIEKEYAYEYVGYEIIDDNSIHLVDVAGSEICFVAGDTNINGFECMTIDDIITMLDK